MLDMSRGPSLDTQPAYGRDGVANAIRRYLGTVENYSFEAERLTDHDLHVRALMAPPCLACWSPRLPSLRTVWHSTRFCLRSERPLCGPPTQPRLTAP
jgi:hypothetical protein